MYNDMNESYNNDENKNVDGNKNGKKIYDMKFFIGFGAVILCVVLIIVFSSKGSFGLLVSSDGDKFKSEYEKYNGKDDSEGKKYLDVTINGAGKIKYSTEDEIVDLFNNAGDAVIYFGYPTCGYCRTVAEVLCDTAKDTELETIYYLDTENGVSGDFMQILDDRFIINNDGDKRLVDPLVLFVTNGVVVSHNIGTLFSHEDPSVAMDAAQISGLEFIYEHGIQDVVDSLNIKKANLELSEEVIN